MLETIKTMIIDFQESELDCGVPRRLQIEPLHGKATICIGVRRSGKSTYMFQLMQHLMEQGVSRQNIVHLNFFDDRLYRLKNDSLQLIPEAYFSLFPDKKNTETVHFFFDEIQTVNGWEPFVDRMMRMEQCEIYLTGSSARMLSKEIATQMRGRALSWEIFPFSFREFLDFKGVDASAPFSTKKRFQLQKNFEGFCETGGFPEVAGLSRPLRIKIHQEYFQAILYRDLIERHDVPHPRSVGDLAHWLVANNASLYSINNLTGYLKSLGHKVPKSSVSDYLEWFEDAFFLFTVRIFDASLSRSNANPKKIYCIDHALVGSTSSGILRNVGHLLENIVFIALRRVSSDIFYYRTKSGKEVDFIVRMSDSTRMLLQVCESLADARTRKREIVALSEAMSELSLQVGTVVSWNEEERIIIDGATIEVVPIWKFLLNLPDV
jgi:predicted AAA+ superfamily ATPase